MSPSSYLSRRQCCIRRFYIFWFWLGRPWPFEDFLYGLVKVVWITFWFGKGYQSGFWGKGLSNGPGTEDARRFQPNLEKRKAAVLEKRMDILISSKSAALEWITIFLISAFCTIINYAFPTPWKATQWKRTYFWNICLLFSFNYDMLYIVMKRL